MVESIKNYSKFFLKVVKLSFSIQPHLLLEVKLWLNLLKITLSFFLNVVKLPFSIQPHFNGNINCG